MHGVNVKLGNKDERPEAQLTITSRTVSLSAAEVQEHPRTARKSTRCLVRS